MGKTDRPVTQEDPFGCGVACTAYLINSSYQDTKNQFNIKKVEEYGCDCPDIKKVLKENGLKYRWGKYKGEKVPAGSVVYLGSSKTYKVGHWLVRTSEGWMNPWVTGESISEAQGGFEKKLQESNITYWVYPEGSNGKN